MRENQYIEKKRLDIVIGKTTNWKELAKDCVCFANSRGGVIYIGIADEESLPPYTQKVDVDLISKIKKQISEHTINVGLNVTLKIAENSGEYIELIVLFNTSTTDGKYYYRSDDTCVPLLPDELSRLFTDKPAFAWELMKTSVPITEIDEEKLVTFKQDIQKSSRTTIHVKQKSNEELLAYYLFEEDGFLTNLGVMWLGKRINRAKLQHAPTIHFLKFNEQEQKVNKLLWEDYSLNPKELVEAIWTQIPDWKEGLDVADGMFRKFVPNYEEEVIRELIANALVHRPYTTRGDVFINLYPDRLEVINPGCFPIGVTSSNVLHKNVRRNPYLAQVFYDLHLMDKEGSGIDKMYQILLTNGKQVPVSYQGDDFVKFTISKHIYKTEIIALINRANEEFQLSSKELISLGLIAQNTTVKAIEFSTILNLSNQNNAVTNWLGRLIDLELVVTKGKTKGLEYTINTAFLKRINFKGKTNLKRIEPYRLEELIYQDIKTYQPTSISEINTRIGEEISRNKLQKTLKLMCDNEVLKMQGALKSTKYFIRQTK
jgi:ATP-dependent DNA helicase RecG